MPPEDDTSFVSFDTLSQLDWPWVVDQVRQKLRTLPARNNCHELLWRSNKKDAMQTMEEGEEVRTIIGQGDFLPLGNPPDIRPYQPRILKGAILQPEELLEVASWMETVQVLQKFLVARREQAPRLYRYAESAPSLSHLIYDIRSCIDGKGEVRDEASPELQATRKKAKKLNKDIHDKLHDYLHDNDFEDLLQDRFYSIKEDRFVLPIKTNQRSFVEGIVLGSSNSGATLFIEPREIVDLNNAHKLVLMESQKEINRILMGICNHLSEEIVEFEKGDNFLTQIDMIHARAQFSETLQAKVPSLNQEEGIQLFKVRHPIILLTKGEVVPNDIVLTPPTRTILVTGPNAGGKTVILKTVGLFALMVRAGLPLPTEEGSNIPFFDHIFSDIGDNQNLHEDRSTFSGHILRVKDFISNLQPTTLALLDELFIATDPQEGSALAQAYLEYLSDTGVLSLATTHFLSLKSLAHRDPRFQNASLGFNPKTLTPTYRLTIDLPGLSNALYIAERFGLPPEIIKRAHSLLGETDMDIQALLLNLQSIENEKESEKDRWEESRKQAEAMQQELQKKMSEVNIEKKEIRRKYREKLERTFQEALQELGRWRRQRNKIAPSSTAANAEYKEIVDQRQRLLSENGLFYDPPANYEGRQKVDWAQTSCGDFVYLPALQSEARILHMPDSKDNVTVEAKGFRLQVKTNQVWKSIGPHKRSESQKPVPVKVHIEKSRRTEKSEESFSEQRGDQCDLRGMTAEEALDLTTQYLDKGFKDNLPRLIIIHGLGKGILRDAIRQYLSQSPYPLTFRPGGPREGGDGVTVVEF